GELDGKARIATSHQAARERIDAPGLGAKDEALVRERQPQAKAIADARERILGWDVEHAIPIQRPEQQGQLRPAFAGRSYLDLHAHLAIVVNPHGASLAS